MVWGFILFFSKNQIYILNLVSCHCGNYFHHLSVPVTATVILFIQTRHGKGK